MLRSARASAREALARTSAARPGRPGPATGAHRWTRAETTAVAPLGLDPRVLKSAAAMPLVYPTSRMRPGPPAWHRAGCLQPDDSDNQQCQQARLGIGPEQLLSLGGVTTDK